MAQGQGKRKRETEETEDTKAKKIALDCQKIAGAYNGAISTLYETRNMFKHYTGCMEVMATLLERQQQKLMDKRLKLVSQDPKNFELTKACLLCKNDLLSSAMEQEDHLRKIIHELNQARSLCAMEGYMITGPWPPVPNIKAASSSSATKTN